MAEDSSFKKAIRLVAILNLAYMGIRLFLATPIYGNRADLHSLFH
jgi:hypothetical protein